MPPSRLVDRLKTAIYAAPKTDPEKAQLRVGFIDGDIPVFPPLATLLLIVGSLLGWLVSKNRMRYLPSGFGSCTICRLVVGIVMIKCVHSTAKACKDELVKAGTAANFEPVIKVCDTGPYRHSRNLMYVAVIFVPMAGSVVLDTAWLLYAAVGLSVYLDRIVVPAEEKMLRDEFGEVFEDYCRKVPRWFRFPTSSKIAQHA